MIANAYYNDNYYYNYQYFIFTISIQYYITNGGKTKPNVKSNPSDVYIFVTTLEVLTNGNKYFFTSPVGYFNKRGRCTAKYFKKGLGNCIIII